MSAIGDLVATLGMNTSPFRTAAAQAVQTAKHIEEKVGASFAKVRSSGASILSGIGLGGLGGVVAGGISATGIYASINAASEAARAQKRLGVILEATGAAADLSKNDLIEYAAQLMKITNYDDDATISAMGTLAVFKQRLSGDMFKDAIKAAMDIASVMGGDLVETTRKLGMALADPAKGMRMLRSEGVMFDAVQQQQIANAIKHNDLVGAQKVIMAQVAATFGGSAERMISPMTQLRNQLEDIGKQFGAFLLPYVRQFGTTVASAVSIGVGWLGALREQFSGLFDLLGDIWNVFASSPMAVTIAAAVPAALALIAALGAIATVATSVGGMLASAFAIITGPVGVAIAAIAMLAAALFYAGVEGDTMQEKISNALTWVKNAAELAGFAWRNFGNVAKLAVVDLALMVLDRFPQMEKPMTDGAAFFIGAWAGAKAFFGNIIAHMKGSLMEFKNLTIAIGDGIAAAWSAMMEGNFSGMASAFTDAFQRTLAAQPNVEAPDAFKTAKEAYDQASKSFHDMVTNEGGMKSFLTNQHDAISQAIAANEKLSQQSARAFSVSTGNAGSNRPKWVPPSIAVPNVGKDGQQHAENKAMERGTNEAWKAIADSMYGSKEDNLRQTADATIEAAMNTARTTAVLEDIRAAMDYGFDIG